MFSHRAVKLSIGIVALIVIFVIYNYFVIRSSPAITCSSPPAKIRIASLPRRPQDLPHGDKYSKEYETSRRSARQSQYQSWLQLKTSLKSLIKNASPKWFWPWQAEDSNLELLKGLYKNSRDFYIKSMRNFDILRQNDGFDVIRAQEATEVKALILEKLEHSQNPRICENAKFLICANKSRWNGSPFCGWGCMVHHALYCLMGAFGSNRTLILDEHFFRLNRHFQPLSSTCNHKINDIPEEDVIPHWPEGSNEDQFVQILPYDYHGFGQLRQVFPPFLPSDLADRIIRLSADPIVWFVGQFVSYILRPNSRFSKQLDQLPMDHPGGAAMHVRRTDKDSEAEFVPIDNYIDVLEEHFDITNQVLNKSVWIATEDPKVIQDLSERFGNIKFLSNVSLAESSQYISNRYEESSVDAIILDVHMLANSDFLVCTMSSNVCRLAYELKLSKGGLVPPERDHDVSLDEDWTLFPVAGYSKYYLANSDQNNAVGLNYSVGDVITVDQYWQHPNLGHNSNANADHQESGDFIPSSLDELFEVSEKFPKFL
jgi:glycoprotein 6-alpha-L-fucosyltransferase